MSEAASEASAVELPAVVPFNLAQTVEALRRRPYSLTDDFQHGEWRRVLVLGGRERVIGVRQCAPDRVRLRALDGALDDEARAEARALVTRVLGLDVDLTPLARLACSDERIRALCAGLVGLKPPRYPSLWVAFASIVPYQQVSLEAAIAIMNRVITALGTPHDVEKKISFGFPSPERFLSTDSTLLRACGLSGAKVRTLKLVAERIVAGDLTEARIEALPDAEAEAALRALPGIGPWSAHLILLRGFRRLTIFPAGDAGATRNLRLFFDVTAEELPRISGELLARLGPYRGYLYFLLLGRNLLARGILTASPLPEG